MNEATPPGSRETPPTSPSGNPRLAIQRLLGGAQPYRIGHTTLLVLVSVFMALAYNAAFFRKVLAIYPPGIHNLVFHTALLAILVALMVFLLELVSSKYTTKPIVALLFFISSLVCYFVNTYGVVVNAEMLQNAVETNLAESLDLFSAQLVLYVLFLGILPAVIVWRLEVPQRPFRKTMLRKATVIGCSLLAILLSLFSSGSTFASFFREHKPVRAYVNPAGYIHAVGKLIAEKFEKPEGVIQPYARDARIARQPGARRLVIFVVGETARADHFSLNGYARETNPLLKREEVVSFTDVMSAGTSTAISVPAMFSHLARKDYDAHEARNTENILDILARLGVSVLWRDNNSSSKGVADRLPYQDFRTRELNTVYDTEARDEGMIVGLQDHIDKQTGDVIIVLHCMGNHGPAYYKRYPKEFEVFTPVCRSNRLEQCSPEEINNAYDNAILYTDYVLSKVIALLKDNDAEFETAMMYFSDHGESLGENNMYLHGYPYALAPIEQKHVPAVFWFGSRFPIDMAALRAKAGAPYSHDHIFHTLLGIFGVETKAYDPSLDMISPFVREK